MSGLSFPYNGESSIDIVLLVVEPTHLKNMLVKMDHFPKVRGENKTSLKPPASSS